jgi:two-component system cell cycle sensor histidine kinase/response regulator CckA
MYESAEGYEAAYGLLETGVVIQDAEARIVYANPIAQDLLGLGSPELLGRSSHDGEWGVIHSDGRPMPSHEHPVPRAIAERRTIRNIVMGVWRASYGDRVWLTVSARPLLTDDGRVDRVVCTFSNITEDRELRERLHSERQELYASVFDAMAEGMVVVDEHRRVREMNPAAARIFDVAASELRGRTIEAPLGAIDEHGQRLPADRYPPLETLAKGVPVRSRIVGFARPDGERRWVSMNTEPVFHRDRTRPRFVVVTFKDITQERHFSEVLRHRQRIEILGSLAAGIAHNFNNALTVIISGLEAARDRPPDAEQAASADALNAARAASALVRQLVLMSRKEARSPAEACDLVALVREVVGMCQRIFDASIALDFDAQVPTAVVYGVSALLQHVVLNLCLNARDALAEVERPRLTLSVLRAEGPVPGLVGDDDAHWVVRVVDNGAGMSPEIAARIGEPFFTTKGIGSGTGLGLATSFGIVRDAGGVLLFSSKPGAGTRFELHLPAHHGAPLEPSSATPTLAPSMLRGRLFLVDDDALVRRALARVLTRCGVEVVELAGPNEALAELASAPPDVAIIDFAMPEMRGDELLRRLRTAAPTLPVIVLSGHVPADVALDGVAAVLHKPIGADELVAVLRPLLPPATPSADAAPATHADPPAS